MSDTRQLDLEMLIEFRVENHRSLRTEQALSMSAARGGDENDSRPRNVHGFADRLLPVTVFYGANASGKSNVLSALAFMRDAVFDSHRIWSPDEGVPRDQFAWGPIRSMPSLYQVTIVLGGIRYEYGFVASDEGFDEEWLFAWPQGKKQTWFSRDRDVFKFGEHFKGENKVIEEVTRNNALFLSAAIQLRHQQLRPVYDWFRSIRTHRIPHRRRGRRVSRYDSYYLFEVARMLESEAAGQPMLFPDDEIGDSRIDAFRSMIKSADVGIVDLKVDPNEDNRSRSGIVRFLFRHDLESDDAWLPLEEESRGTQTLFEVALPIVDVLRRGGLLLADELEASLHPALARQIVQRFNDRDTNPRNAQLIFTTHDTNLIGSTMGEPALRRDQIWLTEKSPEGATECYPLTDFKPRKAENLERGYLQGRYGAIPFLGNFALSGE